jgi:PAS domain S-box-containing protein|tara:strand:- start:5488 stop:7008 length:1521 start_codon:yes stop_codon:yes gene_type:complete
MPEKALLESEARYRSLIENSREVIWRFNPHGYVTYISPYVKEMAGFEPADVIGLSLYDLLSNEENKSRAGNLLAQRVQGIIGGETRIDEFEFFRADGTRFTGEVRSAPIFDEAGEIQEIQGTLLDISVHKQMESELQKMEKLESVGVLAGGIAHDLNNLLTIIIGNLNMARISSDRDERETFLDSTEKSLQRVEDLTKQLLTFAKGGMPILDTNDIRRAIEDCVAFSMHGSHIATELTFPGDLSAVDFDLGQINQVINNLLINARYAMPDGGTIKITAQDVALKSHSKVPLDAGAYVKVSVEDEGSGIHAEELEKIFDPFFSTKDTGSGLGLATAYAIIQKHKGHILAESEPGKGARFDIYLPASRRPAELKKSIEATNIETGTGRILVMDDSQEIQKLTKAMLEKVGYTVSVSENGAEAVELYRAALESGQPFSAVILDLTIPGGMGGKETIEKLRELDPRVKAIVSSGYSVDPVLSHFRDYGFSGVLTKPYVVAKMIEVLNEVL